MSDPFSTFRNLTPHALTIVYPDQSNLIVIPSTGMARLISLEQKEIETISGIQVVGPQNFISVEGLGDTLGDTPILVSMPVGEYLARNPAFYNGPVYGPDTSPIGVVRNEKGEITGTKRLVRYK